MQIQVYFLMLPKSHTVQIDFMLKARLAGVCYRGLVRAGSTGSMEPIDFFYIVVEPVDFCRYDKFIK